VGVLRMFSGCNWASLVSGPYQQGRNLVEDVNDLAGGFALIVHVWRRHPVCVWSVEERVAMWLFVFAFGRDAIDI
jgi:hypothetical protein